MPSAVFMTPDVGACDARGELREAQLASEVENPNRRDFLMVAATSWAAVGAAATLWPLVQQMNPDASTQALASVEVDLSPVKEGQAITVMWRGKPIFIRYRTKAEIEAAEKTPMADLKDTLARNDNLPDSAAATDRNRVKKDHDNWLVMVGICTHLGCIPKGQSLADSKGDYGGWFCPCHGSHYDTAGRIRKGPAPQNLEVPPYQFVSDAKIRIG
ncbi:MAG: ubiquinol-cytochrome c reductase iron-sulfur subunit [Hyphomicrobiaceae bacterium]